MFALSIWSLYPAPMSGINRALHLVARTRHLQDIYRRLALRNFDCCRKVSRLESTLP